MLPSFSRGGAWGQNIHEIHCSSSPSKRFTTHQNNDREKFKTLNTQYTQRETYHTGFLWLEQYCVCVVRLEVKPHVLGLKGDLRDFHVVMKRAVNLQHLVWHLALRQPQVVISSTAEYYTALKTTLMTDTMFIWHLALRQG